MAILASGIEYADLHFQSHARIIATAVIHHHDGVALIDPGPSSTLPTLRKVLVDRGVSVDDITSILLTHIHLDHAGATGTIVRANPDVKVYVHERGAAHLANPDKLLSSASRLYGEDMQNLWGEFLAVPAGNLQVLVGGEQLAIGGHKFEVAYTPGHASHHVCYFEPSSGIAFVGDTGGIRRNAKMIVMPPTPPPDVDLETWRTSVEAIQRWHPSTLLVTHFGEYTDVTSHLQELLDRLEKNAALALQILRQGGSDDEQAAAFTSALRRSLGEKMTQAEIDEYERAGSFLFSWQGLARYWQKRGGS